MLKLTKIYWALILFLCLCAVIDNLLISDTENTLEISSKTEVKSIKINPQFKKYAHSISVKVISKGKDSGSGVVVGKQGNKYLVLTNDSVVRNHDNIVVKTADGINHQAAIMGVDSFFGSADDTALLSFSSGKNYQPVQLNSVDTGVEKKRIYAVGYSADMDKFIVEPGTIERIPIQPFKKGYQIGYTSNIIPGMSGGAILDELGDLVGINGNGASDLSYTDFRYEEDRTKPTLKEIKQFKSLNWGLSTHRLLTKLNSETLTDLKIIKAYGLPIPETVDDIASTQLTGWLADLETEAKQITVRIDSSSEANGSGVIIAKQGNTYTVLTAAHVVCEQDDNSSCINYAYEIVTPDGNKHTLDASTIKAEVGVDLATVKFTSNQSYQVAQLADYSIQYQDAVFVAGYPKLRRDTAPQWQFSLGYSLDREQGLINVNISDDSPQSEDSSTLSQSSLAGGYELVYTSLTYGGMSGGAVLDKQGRVIGIHGQAEGEAILGSRGEGLDKIQLGLSLGIAIDTFIGLKDRLGAENILPVENDALAELNSGEIEAMFAAMSEAEIADSNTTAKGWLKRGNQLWRLGQFDEAITAFDRAIALKPEFIYLAYYGKGRTLIAIPEERTGREEDELAVDSFERATNSNPKFAPAFEDKNFVLRRLNRFDEALAAIKTATILEPENANYHFYLANNLSELQRFDEAIVAYDKAIEITPRSSYYYNRGNCYYNRGKIELALKDYNQALAIEPNHANAYGSRANLYKKQGKAELALEDYNQALTIEPNHARAYISRGRLYEEQEKTELALADYTQALTIDPNYANAYYNRGRLYHKQEKTELALEDYNQALTIDPNDAQTYNNRGAIYDEQGKAELALADYEQALAIEPNHVDTYYNRANLYKKQGKTKLALADYKQVLTIDPNYALAYNSRGRLYHEQGEAELALNDYNQALALNPNDAQTYNNRGLLYDEQGKSELALADYNQALIVDSNHATAYNNRGWLHYRQGKTDLALADYNQTLAIEPNYAEAYNNRGILYHEQGKTELALADFNQALALNPNYAHAYNNRGALYEEQGQVDLALANYAQALAIDPNYANAYKNRGLVYLKIGDKKAAISNFRQAQQLFIAQNNTASAEQTASILQTLEQTPTQTTANSSQKESIASNDAQAYYNQAVGYHEQGEVELALENYDRALALDPKLFDAYINRGVLYEGQGKTDLALADYNQALALNPNDANVYYNRGRLYAQQGKAELALGDFDQTLALNPNDANAYTIRGSIYAQQGKAELALGDFDQALALHPSNAFAYHNRGLLYKQMGDEKAAISDLRQAQQLFVAQNNTANAEQTASILQALDRTPTTQTTVDTSQKDNRASLYSGQVMTIFPPDGTPSYGRVVNPNRKRENENTIAKYDRAIEINPNNSDAYRNRGLLYYQQGQFKLAETDLSKAIELNPEDAEAYYTLGLVYLTSQNSSLAETELETAKRLATSQNRTDLAEEIARVLQMIHDNNSGDRDK